MINKSWYSSDNYEWGSPQDFFDELNEIFEFDLDVCASNENHKCDKYYTIKDDAMKQDWIGVCWMNPPYGKKEYPCKENCNKKICKKRGYHLLEYRPGIGEWMAKANFESMRHEDTKIVCLVPARTDTKWFHESIKSASVIVLIKGRLKFEISNRKPSTAPFPSCLILYGKFNKQEISELYKYGFILRKKR